MANQGFDGKEKHEWKVADHASDPEHTGDSDCPACAKIHAEMTEETRQNAELVGALMTEWDGMITKMGNRLIDKLRKGGRKGIESFVNLGPKKRNGS